MHNRQSERTKLPFRLDVTFSFSGCMLGWLSRRRCHNYTLQRGFPASVPGTQAGDGLFPFPCLVQQNRRPVWLVGRATNLVRTLVPSLGEISLPWHTGRWVVVAGGLRTIKKDDFHLFFDSFIDVSDVLILCTPQLNPPPPRNPNTFLVPPFLFPSL